MKTLSRNFVEGNFYWMLKPHFFSSMLLSKKTSNNLIDKNINFSMRQHESIRGIFVLWFLKQPDFTTPDPFQNVLVVFWITSKCIQMFLLLLKDPSKNFGSPSNTWYLMKGSSHHQGQSNCHKLAQVEKSQKQKKERERKEEIREKRSNEAVPNTLQASASFWNHEQATGWFKFCGLVLPDTRQNRVEGHDHFFLNVFLVSQKPQGTVS